MNILLVEDDKFKQDAINTIIEENISNFNVRVSSSVKSAVQQITENEFDVVILDMSLPSHDLENASGLSIPRLSGGVEILFELQYQSKNPRIIIVTQYPEIELANQMLSLKMVPEFLFEEYEITVENCIFFDFENNAWASKLISGITK